jgi:hypothetical protein
MQSVSMCPKNPNERMSRATLDENEAAADEEDSDPRFLHIMQSSEGADLKRKFFKNIDPTYLMERCKSLETHDKAKFIKFLAVGKTMIEAAEQGNLDLFKGLFLQSDDKELMFWHVSKAFKVAVRNKRLNIIEFIIEDLDMPLNHEAFTGMLHMFIFSCQEAEMMEDPEDKDLYMEVNR